MCPNEKTTPINNNSIDIVGFTFPQLYIGKEWYVGFYAFDPASGKSKRKRYKINFVGTATKKRRYASHLITKLSDRLERGWNPWIESESSNSYHLFSDVCTNYITYLTKLFNDDQLREKTLVDYSYRLNAVIRWNLKRKVPVTYIYQLDRNFIQGFLDYVYIDAGNTARTRNNYLVWIKSFCSFLVNKMYLKTRPSEGIEALRISHIKSDRIIITNRDMERISEHLQETNKHFLLACYMQHYALIRPKEMSHLKIGDFNLSKQTIFVSGQFSKNRKDGVVTLPSKVARLMLDLGVFNNPSSHYLFSFKFTPGQERQDERQFREYWFKMRVELKLPFKYKFYSLKDTGITNMLRTCDIITVRDQARHSSILMTNTYTPQDIQEANSLLKNYQGVF